MQQQLSAEGLKALVNDAHEIHDQEVFRIGDLAKEFGVTLRALRFYEDRGLLEPKRSGSTRLYSLEDRQRLKLILLSKRVGFSLVEIQEILSVHDSKNVTKDSIANILTKFQGQVSVLNEQKLETDRALLELSDAISYLEDMS
ncbi:MAG: transcriptional regulator [Hyphomicrobiales bacterium]|nr:MerR family DNA-binding transcriptional regulator [Hyphomicrobiales bacterium]PCH49577.1 MAG: transcriptional regulator [Hyphomicrobiales bacterium]